MDIVPTGQAYGLPLGSFGTSLGSFQIEEGKSATQIVGNDAPAQEGLVVLGDQEPEFQMTHLMKSLSSISLVFDSWCIGKTKAIMLTLPIC